MISAVKWDSNPYLSLHVVDIQKKSAQLLNISGSFQATSNRPEKSPTLGGVRYTKEIGHKSGSFILEMARSIEAFEFKAYLFGCQSCND